MLVEYLTEGGKKDLLTPHFRFHRLLSPNEEAWLFHEIARLRYQVYCEECGYLDPTAYPEGIETDEYDERSVHIAAHYRSGLLVGTVRLVLAEDGQEFPFETHCTVFPDFRFPPREESGEVSRLIVRREFRRRPGDSLQGVSKEFQEHGSAQDLTPQADLVPHKERRHSSPQIMLGMYREMYRYSLENGIRYWYAAMEKGLAKLLARMGFEFEPVGPETDYYGPVTTYMADLRRLERNLARVNNFLLKWFRDEPISDWLLVTTLVKYKLGHLGRL